MHRKEAIRLVIWDLDETFWRGTISEGGMKEYVQAHHDIVLELAKRGIVSSICSKNNFEDVEKILKQYGLWEYFVMPSIDWTPKGPRLKQLIEDIQLRPETVLFIDDNPGNRAEAAASMPGLQVADETIISSILADPLFKGKNDAGLTRLKQYQLLQKRKIDEKAATDNSEFLRTSNIRVTIEPDVVSHLDRAVELVNRTNQLNFTKLRLPEDGDAAKAELKKLISQFVIQTGLVRVQDNYGDYGYCGFYTIFSMHDERRLIHFCFSCRILGMSIERWLYQKLGRPTLKISGEVISNLNDETEINWINQHVGGALVFTGDDADQASDHAANNKMIAQEIRFRGGCELDALSHYLQQVAPKVVLETNYVQGGILIRKDMSTNMALCFSPVLQQHLSMIETLKFKPQDFDARFFTEAPAGTLFVLSGWSEVYMPLYYHTKLNFDIAVSLRMPGIHNLVGVLPHELEGYLEKTKLPEESKAEIRTVIQYMKDHFQCHGRISLAALKHNWQLVLSNIPSHCPVVVLLPNSHRGGDTPFAQHYHAALREVASAFANVTIVDVTPFINLEESGKDGAIDHLDRMAYYKIYKHIVETQENRPKTVAEILSSL